MRIAIDVRTVTPLRSGVGNYVLNLLEGLRQAGPEHELFLVGQEENLRTIGWSSPPHTVYRAVFSHESHPLGDLWEHLWLPRVLEASGVEVFHGPATLIPLRRAGYATVVTVHDLVAFLYPQTIPYRYGLYMRWLLKQVVARAERIISVSHSTRRDLERVLGVDPAKVTVVYEAAHPDFCPIRDRTALERVRRHYGLEGPFVYHVGNIEPRKNLVRLVRAFGLVRRRLGRRVSLVISGQRGWLTSHIFRDLDQMDLQGVIFTGYVPRQDLPLLMNAAEVFVFPSLYEGFGLPALEAMSCGTPVVTSNISSLPEIVGEAAVLVDPQDAESIAEGLLQVLSDPELRQDLSRRGLERAARFSWLRAARETLAVYEDALQARSGR